MAPADRGVRSASVSILVHAAPVRPIWSAPLRRNALACRHAPNNGQRQTRCSGGMLGARAVHASGKGQHSRD